MSKLIVAASPTQKPKLEAEIDERTAGQWRKSVTIVELYDSPDEKVSNNGEVEHLSRTSDVTIYAAKDLTSKWLEANQNVKRLTRSAMIKAINDWLARNGLSWRDNVNEARSLGAYQWADIKAWRDQFKRVDPDRGLRVAAAILAQLKIARVSEMADWFHTAPPVEHNAFFVGSDPHSGDFGIINTLAARIPGPKLSEIQQIPSLSSTASIRIFSDGGWSGGESVRRLECACRPCENKAQAIGPDNKIWMRFAYLTDIAASLLEKKVDELTRQGLIKHRVNISCPPENRLFVCDPHGEKKIGLAFQNPYLCAYVDKSNPNAMYDLCKTIGEQISQRRPLGTHEIASTIAFEHSLPKAMLPVLIIGGKQVTDHDGQPFTWTPLLHSEHVGNPARDKKGYYCKACPLDS